MTPWRSLATALAQKLRLHCRCQFDYDRKLVRQCSNCAVLEQYDRAVAEENERPPIVQTPDVAAERVRGRDG